MKNRATKFLLAICLTLLSLSPAPAQANNELTKALWVWDFYEAASDYNKTTQLLEFLNKNNINLLFIGTKNTLTDQPATYEELIRRAHENGIRVFALVGRANWALETHHREALEQLRQVLTFNESRQSSKFDGIQFDIEPHTLPEYKTKRGSVAFQYIQVLKKIANEISARDKVLEFNAAIPWWYGGGENPVMVETGGERKPLSHFVLDIVDTVSIMAYRDTAERQIRGSLADTDYAAKIGKTIYIGTETNPPNGSTVTNEITYYNTGMDYLNEQINTVIDHYSGHDGFGGIAIHSYPSLKEMIEKE